MSGVWKPSGFFHDAPGAAGAAASAADFVKRVRLPRGAKSLQQLGAFMIHCDVIYNTRVADFICVYTYACVCVCVVVGAPVVNVAHRARAAAVGLTRRLSFRRATGRGGEFIAQSSRCTFVPLRIAAGNQRISTA